MRAWLLLILLALLPGSALAQGYKPRSFTLMGGAQLCLNGATCTTRISASSSTSGMLFNSAVANSGTNAAYTFDTTNALSGSTALFSVKKAGTEYVRISQGGNVQLLDGATLCFDSTTCSVTIGKSGSGVLITAASGATSAYFIGTTEVRGANFYDTNLSLPVTLRTNHTDDGSGIAGVATSDSAWTVAGAKLFSFQNNGTEKAHVDLNGGLNAHAALLTKRSGVRYIAQTNSTNFTGFGISAPATVVGTPTAQPAADGTMMMVRYATGAVSGNDAGWLDANLPLTRANYRPRLVVTFRTDSAVTSQRIFIGLVANTDISGSATLAALNTINCAVLRFDTDLSDTTFQAITSDGSTASATNTGVTVAANTTYTVVIDLFTSGHAAFYIYTGGISPTPTATVDTTTNLPTGTTDLGIHASISTLTAAARNLFIARAQLDQN